MFNDFPYTNWHGFNYNWIIKQVKKALEDAKEAKEISEEAFIKVNEILAIAEDANIKATNAETLSGEAKDFSEEALSKVNSAYDESRQAINDVARLSARMDEYERLEDGSTTGDAELADIRVAYNGMTYPNAGTSVRSQIEQAVSNNENLFKKTVFTYHVQPNGNYSVQPRALSDAMLINGKAITKCEAIPYMHFSYCLYSTNEMNSFIGYTDEIWHEVETGLYEGEALYMRLYFGKLDNTEITDEDFNDVEMTVVSDFQFPSYYEINTAEDAVARNLLNNKIKGDYLTIGTWNVGLWNNGSVPGMVAGREKDWYKKIGEINADILCTQESQLQVNANMNYPEFLGNKYDYMYAPLYGELDYTAKGICTKRDLLNKSRHWVADRPYTMGYIIYQGKSICIINIHCPLTAEERKDYLEEVFNIAQQEDYCIICGDTNIESLEELKDFTDAGYKLSNDGIFGQFKTWEHGGVYECLDNVIVSGNINIQNVYTIEGTGDYIISDHKALVAIVKVN